MKKYIVICEETMFQKCLIHCDMITTKILQEMRFYVILQN